MHEQIMGFDVSNGYEYENGFYLTTKHTRLAKAIAHWEIYKQIANVPGEIVECGTFKGASFIRFLTFREMLENPYSRKAISFDAFGCFPSTNRPADMEFIESFEGMSGKGISRNELDVALKLKGFVNYELVQGNILQTLMEYLQKNNSLKIALLHIDVDVYDATSHCLNILYGHVTRGGAVILDDYSIVEGANKAIDEFIASHPEIELKKYGFYSVPSYFIKR